MNKKALRILFIFIFITALNFICYNLVFAQQPADFLKMDVEVGFDNSIKTKAWSPVIVFLENTSGNSFSGELVVEGRKYQQTANTYTKRITVPANSKKRHFIYVPFNNYQSKITVKLMVKDKPLLEKEVTLRTLYEKDVVILVLSKDKGSLNFLASTQTQNIFGKNMPSKKFTQPTQPSGQSAQVKLIYGDIKNLPDKWKGYDAVNLMVINNAALDELTEDQCQAIINWLRAGGNLIISSNLDPLEYNRSPLKELIPLQITKTSTLDKLSSLTYFTGGPLPLSSAFIFCEGSLIQNRGKVLAEEDKKPLVVQNQEGLGKLVYLAFNVSSKPASEWGMALWTNLLGEFFTPSSQTSSYYYPSTYDNFSYAASRIPAMKPPSFGFIGCFLILYILIIGPVNYFILKKLGRQEFALFTIPAIVLFFTFGSYFIGYSVKGGNIILNRISVVSGVSGENPALLETYFSLFSPKQDFYTITLDNPTAFGNSENIQSYRAHSIGESLIKIAQDEKVTFEKVSISMWSMKPFKAESLLNLKAPLTSNLTLKGDEISGRLTNQTGYNLKDCYLVYDNRFIKVGDFTSSNKEIKYHLPALPPQQHQYSYSYTMPNNLANTLTKRAGEEETAYQTRKNTYTAMARRLLDKPNKIYLIGELEAKSLFLKIDVDKKQVKETDSKVFIFDLTFSYN